MKKRPGANFMVSDQLMGEGGHFDDDPDGQRRLVSKRYDPEMLPRSNMLTHIMEEDLRRPIRSSFKVI